MSKKIEGRAQEGFTILEVIMFIAISGALLALMVFAVYRMLDNSRFSDTITSAASFVQTQYEEARSGVRPDGTGICETNADIGRSDCLLLGKAIVFREGSSGSETGLTGKPAGLIESYFVISRADDGTIINAPTIDTDPDNYEPEKALIDAQPILTSVGHREYPLMYSAYYAVTDDDNFKSAGLLYRTNNGAGGQDSITDECDVDVSCNINVILILRNPRSAALNTYAFHAALGGIDVVTDINNKIADNNYAVFRFRENDDTTGRAVRNASTVIPIVNGDSNSRSLGAICIEQGASSASVFGLRELSYYKYVNNSRFNNKAATIPIQDIIKDLREKCENA
jgi:type II secretory pathway pseudopilin PulG